MRRVRRRRPAGQPRVPVVVGDPGFYAATAGPAVVRIGSDRSLLDAPWAMAGCAIAHVWLDETAPGRLVRAVWPRDPRSQRPIAPLDLQLGHTLEISMCCRTVREARYACVADVDYARMVLVPSASVLDAIAMARQAVDVWQVAELAAVEDAWRDRIEAARRFYGDSR